MKTLYFDERDCPQGGNFQWCRLLLRHSSCGQRVCKTKNFAQSQAKGKYIYELTPRGIRAKAALTVSFLERKKNEYEDLKLEIERLESELGVDDKGKPDNAGDAI